MWEKFLRYFSNSKITEGFLIALSGSSFIYFEYFDLNLFWLETLLAIAFFTLLINANSRAWFWSGFFIGVFWFWWIGVSFIHYKHSWALVLVDFIVALIYGLLLFILAYIAELIAKKSRVIELILKATIIFFLSRIHPFGFDWLKLELVLIHTPFKLDELSFISLLAFIVSLLLIKSSMGKRELKLEPLIAIILLYFAIDSSYFEPKREIKPNRAVELVNTNIPVEKRWQDEFLRSFLLDTYSKIDRAIKAKKSLIVFPEATLPIFLNRSPNILNALLKRSKEIDIVIGALYLDNKVNRNSAYFFHKGAYKVANKVVLVPFGEANPLPNWASKIVNRIFFDGAPDYKGAKAPSDFLIGKKRYRVAICYEGTSDKFYLDNPPNLILISNNGWFYPSIEPTLQKLLLEYYARRYRTTIYHSANMSPSYVITPTSYYKR